MKLYFYILYYYFIVNTQQLCCGYATAIRFAFVILNNKIIGEFIIDECAYDNSGSYDLMASGRRSKAAGGGNRS